MPLDIKHCPKCRNDFPRDTLHFYTQRIMPDGLTPYCQACWRELCRQRHAKKREGMVDKRRVLMQSVRHSYFASIDSHLQAYILGLLASDGTVGSSRPRIKLSVHEKDVELVELVRNQLAPGYPIRYQAQYSCQMTDIAFTSSEMCANLALLGVVPRKSLHLIWPELLPMEFANSYLLGIFDGDGWITRDARKINPYYSLGIMSASHSFLERAAEIIGIQSGLRAPAITRVNNRAWMIQYGGKHAIALSRWLHRDIVGLARKRPPIQDDQVPKF